MASCLLTLLWSFLVHTFLTSRIDCYFSILVGTPSSIVGCLDQVLRSAARVDLLVISLNMPWFPCACIVSCSAGSMPCSTSLTGLQHLSGSASLLCCPIIPVWSLSPDFSYRLPLGLPFLRSLIDEQLSSLHHVKQCRSFLVVGLLEWNNPSAF